MCPEQDPTPERVYLRRRKNWERFSQVLFWRKKTWANNSCSQFYRRPIVILHWFFLKNTMKKSLSLAAGFCTGRGSPVWPCATKKNSVTYQKWFLAKVLGEPDYFVRKINKWIHTCIINNLPGVGSRAGPGWSWWRCAPRRVSWAEKNNEGKKKRHTWR